MILLKRISLWLALAGVVFTGWVLMASGQKAPMPRPLDPPPKTPYQATVAAAGIIEAVNENVKIAPPQAGLITAVRVLVGDTVEEGAPLFQLDDRELKAQLATRESAVPALQARIREQELWIEDQKIQLARLQAVSDRRGISEDEVKRKHYQVEMGRASLERNQAEMRNAVVQRNETKALLERLAVRAPRAGQVLQVNIRAGEYAMPGSAEPLILLGDTRVLQIRADVDEVNAPLVRAQKPAVAYLKGSTKAAIPLEFVRIEPYIIPKKSLTGDNTERVDTRVLQVVYRFTMPAFPVYVGQQVDVFIEGAGVGTKP